MRTFIDDATVQLHGHGGTDNGREKSAGIVGLLRGRRRAVLHCHTAFDRNGAYSCDVMVKDFEDSEVVGG